MSINPRYKQEFCGSHLPQAAGKFRKSFDLDRAFAEISLGGTCWLVNVSTSTAIVAKAQTFPDFITWDRSTGCYRTSKPPLAEQHWFRDAATATADRCGVLSGLAHRCALLRRSRCVCRRDAAGGGLRRNGRDRPVRAVRRPGCWCASRREGHPPGARNFHYCFSATDPHTQANIGRSTEDSGPTRHSKAAQGATSKSKEFDWRWMIGTPMGAERRSNSTLDRGIVVTSVGISAAATKNSPKDTCLYCGHGLII